jgi:hypothetical protein
MIAQHREHDGQREIVVVDRTLLGDLAPDRIGFLVLEQRGDRFALAGNDDDSARWRP